MRRFDNKVVFITGAASGIGKASAIRLSKEGAKLFLCDLNEKALLSLKEGLTGDVEICAFDISKQDSVKKTLQNCIDLYGKIDSCINMAGILKFEFCHQLNEDDWDKIIGVNLTGTFYLMKAVIPHLIQSQGNIVNAASTSSLAGLPWSSAYAASKGGVLALTNTIAVEYAKQGIRANCVCPGDIHTPMVDNLTFPEGADFDMLPRISSLTGMKGPDVVAGVIAMLASDDAVHITGEHIRVDGGTLS